MGYLANREYDLVRGGDVVKRSLGFILAGALVMTACTATGAKGDEGSFEHGLLNVETIEVRIAEKDPVQVIAHVEGWVGDGCTEVDEITQERSENNTINVTITTRRPKDAVCTMVLQGWSEDIFLTGPFEPGEYVLNVNDKTTVFRVD